MQETLLRSLQEAHALLRSFIEDRACQDGLLHSANLFYSVLSSQHKILVCGNGGSLADAMHFAEEWTGRFREDRRPYPALALSDPTHLTCVANDFGFEQVFARGVEAFGQQGDLLLLLTTSGQSANLLRAAEKARDLKIQTVAFVGKGGGALAGLCDLAVNFPGTTSDRIQEIQMLALHALIEAVEAKLG